jgi:hypothetical protein
MFWAISIHTVTAFLFAASSARPFWHIALLAPRFIATAFVSGPALIIIVLQILRRTTRYPVPDSVIDTLSLIMTVALQISLFFVGRRAVHGLLQRGPHAASVRYLYFGLEGLNSLSPFVWTALAMNLVARVHSFDAPPAAPAPAAECGLRAGVLRYLDREGHGFRGAGFHPDAAGRGLRIQPDGAGAVLSAGIWATGILVFTLLARASIAISLGEVGAGPAEAPAADAAPAAA